MPSTVYSNELSYSDVHSMTLNCLIAAVPFLKELERVREKEVDSGSDQSAELRTDAEPHQAAMTERLQKVIAHEEANARASQVDDHPNQELFTRRTRSPIRAGEQHGATNDDDMTPRGID